MTCLALVVPIFPRLSETFIVNKFTGLLRAGWDVHVVAQAQDKAAWAAFPELSREDVRRRVHIAAPHEPRWQAAARWLPETVGTAVRSPAAARAYWGAGRSGGLSLLKESYLDAPLIALRPDIIHFEFGTLALGRAHLKQRLGSRLSVSFRGYDLNLVRPETPGYFDEVWREADAIHLLGRDLWQRAQRRGCPSDKPHVLIPPAIDVDFFRPSASRDNASRDNAPGRPLRVLSVGRLEWKKGYEYALEAIRRLCEKGVAVEYRIIGGGSYLESLAFCRHELGLEAEVTFMGARPREAVRQQMQWADVFLHAAVSEGFCNAAIEAQAMQLPVVSSDADGLSENVADGKTGYVVPRRDAAALADRLALLAADPALRERMGRAGRERATTLFRLEDQIAAFDRFYRTMVAKP